MLVLSLLLLALATPAPQPTATNPFTLEPISGTPLPRIGSTHNRQLCTAVRTAVPPALRAAQKNDAAYDDFRKWLFDYNIRTGDAARDLKIVQMDHQIDLLVKSTKDLEEAIGSPSLQANPNTPPDDAHRLAAVHDSMASVLAAQKVQLDAMSGFLETERATRFGQHDESMRQMEQANTPAQISTANPLPTDAPNGFLQDTQDVFKSIRQRKTISVADQHDLDHDLDGIGRVTQQREKAAADAIVAAANKCK